VEGPWKSLSESWRSQRCATGQAQPAGVAQGLEPVGSTPEQFADYIRREYAKHAKLIQDAGLKFE
jgi:tripartite-type tricarboxylate transporter receptor subunit TctC